MSALLANTALTGTAREVEVIARQGRFCATGSALHWGRTITAADVVTFVPATNTVSTDSVLIGWEHQIDETGVACTRIALADGRTLDSQNIRGTVNRLVRLPSDWPQRAIPADQGYAASELSAFFASWLHSLPRPLINSPTPGCLAGPHFPPSGWVIRAVRAGLSVAAYREESLAGRPGRQFRTYADSKLPPTTLTTHTRLVAADAAVHTLLVVGPEVIAAEQAPEPSPAICQGCRRLATEVNATLLGVDFVVQPTQSGMRWLFAGASLVPDLRPGGEPLLDALALVLAPLAKSRPL